MTHIEWAGVEMVMLAFFYNVALIAVFLDSWFRISFGRSHLVDEK